MSVTFTKLFASITESTIWCEPDRVRIVWITMLAMADKHGRVWGSVPGLAHRAHVPVEDTRDALRRFLEPDADSRTPERDGRRIESIDGGWRLLNYEKYRAVRDEEDRREYQRVKKQESRQRMSTMSTMSTEANTNSHNAEAEAEAEIQEPSGEAKLLPEMVARAVLVETGLSGRELNVVLSDIVGAEATKPDYDGLRLKDLLVAAWRDFSLVRAQLEYPPGAAKFFGEGYWRDRAMWKYKAGEARPMSAMDKLERANE